MFYLNLPNNVHRWPFWYNIIIHFLAFASVLKNPWSAIWLIHAVLQQVNRGQRSNGQNFRSVQIRCGVSYNWDNDRLHFDIGERGYIFLLFYVLQKILLNLWVKFRVKFDTHGFCNILRESLNSPCIRSHQIHKIAGCACAGNAGSVFPATDFKGNH